MSTPSRTSPIPSWGGRPRPNWNSPNDSTTRTSQSSATWISPATRWKESKNSTASSSPANSPPAVTSPNSPRSVPLSSWSRSLPAPKNSWRQTLSAGNTSAASASTTWCRNHKSTAFSPTNSPNTSPICRSAPSIPTPSPSSAGIPDSSTPKYRNCSKPSTPRPPSTTTPPSTT